MAQHLKDTCGWTLDAATRSELETAVLNLEVGARAAGGRGGRGGGCVGMEGEGESIPCHVGGTATAPRARLFLSAPRGAGGRWGQQAWVGQREGLWQAW